MVDVDAANDGLAALDAEGRVAWALANLPGTHVVTSSFGAQAAVALHLVTRLAPATPVVLVDTGYLFPETYRFIDELTERLALDLRVYRSVQSPAWQEARYGKLWEQGIEGIDRYNAINKVEPLQRALAELGVGTWIAGLRRSQAETRAAIRFVEQRDGRYKLHPLADWSDRDVGLYLRQHGLPYHPLWEQGYVSIGDWHTTRPIGPDDDPASARFFGLKRECGIHGLEG